MLELCRMREKVRNKELCICEGETSQRKLEKQNMEQHGKTRNGKKIQDFANGSGRAKTILELMLVKDVKGNEKPVSST